MALLDTLLSAFKGGERNRVPLFPGYLQAGLPAFGAGEHTRSFDYRRAVEAAYLANPIAQRAVRIVAEGIGQAPLSCGEADLARLVKATSSGQPLIESLAAHVLLHGNGYIQILKDASGKPVELFALRPDRVSIIAGPDGWPEAFRYEVGGEAITILPEDENGWPSVVQVKTMHPLDDHLGAGSLAAAFRAITVHNAATAWNQSLLENAARPSGALVYEGSDGAGLSADQFDRVRDELENAFAGAVNAGRPLLLDGGLKWQSMALSPADMDFATLKSAAAREIALAFGVPPMLLGLPGDNTYSNYREANRALWRLTLLPLAHKLLSALDEGLEPWFPNAGLAIDLDRITALSEDRERLWNQVSDADFLSRAEKRQLLGFPTEESAR